MLRNGIIDQDYKILKNHVDGDETLDTIHFSAGYTNNINENKNNDSPFSYTQVTPNKPDKDPTLVTSDLENHTTVLALPFIDTYETPNIKTQSTLSVNENNQATFRLEPDDTNAIIIALKSFLINKIYDLRQEPNQPIKSLNKQEDLTDLKIQLQYLQRENKSYRIETVPDQNNELLKLNREMYNKNNVMHYQEKYIKECPKHDDFQIASKTATKKIKQSLEKDMDNSNNKNCFISSNCFMKIIMMTMNK